MSQSERTRHTNPAKTWWSITLVFVAIIIVFVVKPPNLNIDFEKITKTLEQLESGYVPEFTPSNIDIIDGDTFKVSGEKIRLWGIDAFEIKQQCFDNDKALYPCGVKAKIAILELLKTGEGRLKCLNKTKDKYDRSIARCWINGKDIGAALVKSGWAVDYTRYSDGLYNSEEEEAKKNNVGAWAGCFAMPWDFRRNKNSDICE